MRISFVLSLVATTAGAFTVSRPVPRRSTTLNLYDSVEAAIEEANRICADDPTSQECRVAWDIVEELEAADSHRGGIAGPNASTDFVALLDSFDILVRKIDGKMDQLIATTDKFVELGATDPYVPELGERAMDMKQALAYVRESLRQ